MCGSTSLNSALFFGFFLRLPTCQQSLHTPRACVWFCPVCLFHFLNLVLAMAWAPCKIFNARNRRLAGVRFENCGNASCILETGRQEWSFIYLQVVECDSGYCSWFFFCHVVAWNGRREENATVPSRRRERRSLGL